MSNLKKPENGGKLYCLNEDNELLQASAVSAPASVDLSKWIEFSSEQAAYDYFGIVNPHVGEYELY